MKYGEPHSGKRQSRESPQVEDEVPVGFSDLTPEPQKVQ